MLQFHLYHVLQEFQEIVVLEVQPFNYIMGLLQKVQQPHSVQRKPQDHQLLLPIYQVLVIGQYLN